MDIAFCLPSIFYCNKCIILRNEGFVRVVMMCLSLWHKNGVGEREKNYASTVKTTIVLSMRRGQYAYHYY